MARIFFDGFSSSRVHFDGYASLKSEGLLPSFGLKSSISQFDTADACAGCGLKHTDGSEDGCGGGHSHVDGDTNWADWLIGTDVDPSTIASLIPADVTTTAELVVGVQTNSAIDFAGDRDWFRVELTDGQTYEIIAAGTGVGISALDVTIRLYDETGTLITLDNDGGVFAAGQLNFTAFGDQVFFVEVDASGSDTGSYTLNAEVFDNGADNIANGISNNPVIVVDGADGSGRIDYNTDEDWFAVELVAGQNYLFELNGTGADALNDAYLTIHAEDGTIITFNDDGGPGLNSRLVYQATSTGTYYLAAQGFTGNSVDTSGDYSLSASTTTETASILDALDWGTQLNVTVVDVYFAGVGETFDGNTSNGWTQAEIDAVMDALGVYENYINLEFRQTNNSTNAEFVLVVDSSDEYLGFFGPPNTGAGTGVGVFSDAGTGWSTTGLVQGGFGFVTVIHEVGHGLGLAHPHDGGGTSGVLNGVFDSASTGQFDLNQGIYTTMSYIDGWDLSPYGTSGTVRYGWQGTPMALDIAVLQGKYGANTTHNNGNDTYTIQTANAAGTFWQSIWDTGGIDTISYAGDADARIDLREATLQYEEGGGGFLSYADGLYGGFTIANGVDIENITAGGGDDLLIGNALANVISAGAGDDLVIGGAGGDTLDGGTGNDTLSYFGSSAGVTINLGINFARGGDAQGDVYNNFENITGSSFGDTLIGDSLSNVIIGGAGGDKLFAYNGDDIIYGGTGGDRIVSHNGDDEIYGEEGNDWLYGLADDDIISGGSGNDNIFGGTGQNTLLGGSGNDRFFIDVGASIDNIDGGSGEDRVVYRNITTQSIRIDLIDPSKNSGAAAGHILQNIETLDGTQLGDIIAGSNVGRDKIFGWGGDDIIRGRAGDDLIWGVDGDDTLSGGGGFDQLRGGDGEDTLNGDDGDDLLDGGNDNDTLNGGAGADKLIGNLGDDVVNGGDGDDRVTGQQGDDTLNGDAGEDDVLGGDGNDTMSGGDGNDFMRGNTGDDIINGDAGNDIIYGDQGVNTMDGGTGNDTFYVNFADSVDDITGGEGIDRVIYRSIKTESITIDLNDNSANAGAALGDRLTTVENIDATDLSDVLRGSSADNALYGWGGNDTIEGREGDDTLDGGSGDDTLNGGSGSDTMFGDMGVDFMAGGSGNDVMDGGAGDDVLTGDTGNDTLSGGDGFDFLDGGAGDDILNGGDLGDIIIGGDGADTLTGGAGADVFVFNEDESLVGSSDTITDFGVDDILATASHTFRGTDGFTATGVFEVRYVSDATETYFEFDRNGDGVVDERIDLDTNSIWTFTSQGEEISGAISGPAEPDMLG